MPRSSHPAELPLTTSKSAAQPLPAQIAEQVRDHILAGTLKPADALPSSRALAARLGISRGSVVAAYEQLAGEGYLSTDSAGTWVAHSLPADLSARISAPLNGDAKNPHPARAGKVTTFAPPPASATFDLRPGTPDTSLLTTSAWRAAWRKAAAEPGTSYPAEGSPHLQTQLAEHLRVMRSVAREPHEILVTAGARDAFRLVLSALRRQRHDRPLRIAVENPGYPSLHKIPAAFGHEILSIDVDEHGLNPARLPQNSRVDIVLVTPSHQYPLGASMPIARRLELLEWAEENGAFIIEDDYDSELRYVGDPLPALAALDRQTGHDCVITLGSFTKTLTPGLGLGYLLAPNPLMADIAQLREVLGSPVSSITQDAMAQFLADGGARRHIARMRRVYKRRRDILLNALTDQSTPDWVQVLPMDGGLHAVLEFTGEYATYAVEQQFVQRAAEKSLTVATLGDYWAHSGTHHSARKFGAVIGFGGISERHLPRALELATGVLRSL